MAERRGPAHDLLAVDAYIAALRQEAGWVRNGGASRRLPRTRGPEPVARRESSEADPDLTCAAG